MEPQIGDKFGKLTVIKEPFSKNGRYWPCLCDCGETLNVNITDLKKKAAKNGGCKSCFKGPTYKHGFGSSKNGTYSKYQAMRQRCENENHIAYANYGGRGIKVYERWQKFENFLEDMGECPGESFSIEKINNDEDYSPENCKWATRAEQAKNKRNNVKVEIDGVYYPTLKDACDAFKMKYNTVKVRIATYKWDIERALKTPIL